MAIDDLVDPVIAPEVAKFGPGKGGKAAQINYSVPLPGTVAADRLVELEVPRDWFADGAWKAGKSLLELGVVEGDQGRLTRIDKDRLVQLYRQAVPATARPSLRRVAEVGGVVEPLLDRGGLDRTKIREQLLDRRQIFNEPEDVERQRVRIDSYLSRLAETETSFSLPNNGTRTINLPVRGIGNSIHTVPVDPVAHVRPRFALVETWELRSYLGDYGLGRTLQTFSLLPGEKTTITVETWRSSSATQEDASSIFDSSDTAAQTRFTSSLTSESGAAFQDQGGWATSASVSASAGFNFLVVSGSVSAQAGFAANHQESSQRWSGSMRQASEDHANQVNNSRRQSVESTSTYTVQNGTSTTTVREITNTNLRRVLNFVFRELNQTYETYSVLRETKLAFCNGNSGSYEVVPLSEIGGLIRRYVLPEHQEKMARFVLSACVERIDADAKAVTTLQVGTKPVGAKYYWESAKLGKDGSLDFPGDVLAANVSWRFTPGALSTDDRKVRGVVMNRGEVVLRTDNVVVEALLGQADALDPYASAVQAIDLLQRSADANARAAETERLTDALALVDAQPVEDRIEAWQKIFPDQPDIQVVPVAAVSSNGDEQP